MYSYSSLLMYIYMQMKLCVCVCVLVDQLFSFDLERLMQYWRFKTFTFVNLLSPLNQVLISSLYVIL